MQNGLDCKWILSHSFCISLYSASVNCFIIYTWSMIFRSVFVCLRNISDRCIFPIWANLVILFVWKYFFSFFITKATSKFLTVVGLLRVVFGNILPKLIKLMLKVTSCQNIRNFRKNLKDQITCEFKYEFAKNVKWIVWYSSQIKIYKGI